MSQSSISRGKVEGMPLFLLRVEGLALFLAACTAYQLQGGHLWLFLALFLVPDVAMLGYLKDARLGAYLYNLAHTTTTYFVVLAFGVFMHNPSTMYVAIIGLAHVGLDRAMGYGLKYPEAFKETHLGVLGPNRS